VCDKRKERRRVRQVLPESIILFVFKPVARAPPNYIHANHSEMTGERGSQTVKIPAVAGQPMDADNNSVLTWVSPFAVCNAMKTVGIECKKAMLVRLRCHVRLKNRPETGSVQFSYFVARRRVPSRLVQGRLFPRQLVGGAAKHDQQHMALLDELAHRGAI